MSRKEELTMAIGGTPRVDLMPVAVKEAIKRRPIVRRLIAMVVLLIVVALLAVAGATYLALNAQLALALEQQRSDELLGQQLQYAEAREASRAVEETLAAQRVATLTEADWSDLLGEIRATLPPGVLLTSVTGVLQATESDEPIPLREDSVGSFRISAISDTVPNVELWIAELETITGYAGIAPPVSVQGGEGSIYTVSIEVLIDEDVFINRFAPETEEPTEEEGD